MNAVEEGAAVSLRGVSKTFGDVKAVRELDLMIAPGEVVALLGPNGAGKTTTMEMLLGLSTPDTGSIRVFNRTPQAAIRNGLIGAMLQSGGFLQDLTGTEIVRLIAAQFPDPLPVAGALDRAGMTGHANRRYGSLSGGQQQRIRFAAALACDPDLLVLDEPTVAMDVRSRQDFWKAMREFTSGGRTVLFATHYLAEAQDIADRVVLIAKGEIVADGAVSEVTARVDGRTISATNVSGAAGELASLPGVDSVELHDGAVTLHSLDPDRALRAFLGAFPHASNITVSAMSLEDAFLALTAERG